MLQITSGPDLLQPWCQTWACGNAGAEISAGLLLLLGLLQHQWKMRDAEVKGYPQGSALGFQPYYLGWGSMCLLSPTALTAHFVPQGPKFPGSPGAAPPSSSPWPAFEQHRIKEQHFGCPGELGLRNAVVLGWRMINFLLFLQRTMGVWDSFFHSVWLWT